MTTTLSNLYVEKASSEHPLALWMMNEQVDYISQITEPQRQIHLFATWDVQYAEAILSNSLDQNAPFQDSTTTRLEGYIPAGPLQDIIMTSKFELSENLEADLQTVAIGFYLFIDSSLGDSVTFGYKYVNQDDEEVEVFSTTNINRYDIGEWKFFSESFAIPPSTAQSSNIVIRVTTKTGGGPEDYRFYINGLSVGQQSENFSRVSYGITPGSLPTNIALPSSLKALPAYPYGTSGEAGYYVSQGYKLCSQNFGVPLVFGSSNTTKLYPNFDSETEETYPSLIFPGYGFLNERGRYNDYTVEMWVRINSSSLSVRRIFGPITGTDGLYVDGAFLTFKAGKVYGSHFVGDWFRPMLIHIRFMKDTIIVILNGEEVITVEYSQTGIDLPSEFNEEGENQNWLGFYSYEDINPIEIDTFSIYSYAIPTDVSKRRWVWGQGVTAPEQTNSSINSITAYNDYAFANYAANYNYPDIAKFKQAFINNMEADARTLMFPDYELPEFSFNGKTDQEWFDAIGNRVDSDNYRYFTLKPNVNAAWSNNTDFIHFNEFSVLNEPVETFYGVFQTNGTEVNKILFKVVDSISKDYIVATINGTTLTYRSNISGAISTLATKTVTANKRFTAGMNATLVSLMPINDINKFFTNQPRLSLYLGGDGTSKFSGNIYKFGFDSAFNNRKLEEKYDDNGFFLLTDQVSNFMTTHTANYTFTPVYKFNMLFADIAVSGYWQDYAPLSYFAKYIANNEGSDTYDLDSIQFNQDFPEPTSSDAAEEISDWTYAELYIQYSQPTILTYANLNNEFYTRWDNYEDMSQNSVKTTYFNTEDSILRSYVSFQPITSGANKDLLSFSNYAKPLTRSIVDPDLSSSDWQETVYETTNGSLIYPPKSRRQNINNAIVNSKIDFNDYAIVYHLEFKTDGIKHQPIKFKELQLASHVLESTDFTPVGSRFGIPVYYYFKDGAYYDLKAKNPISTYKKSTPYLYLNKDSGWSIKGDFSSGVDRGLAIPINLPAADKIDVSSIQMWVRYAEKEFPFDPVMVFSIFHYQNDELVTYDFFLQADAGGQRGKIFGINHDTLEILDTIKYYINGQAVKDMYLSNSEWAVLGLEFPELLNFDYRVGRLNLNGPLIYNNVSYNLATNIEKNELLETRSWNDLFTIHQGGITDVTTNGTQVTYYVNNRFQQGDYVTVTQTNPNTFDLENVLVVNANSESFTVASTVTDIYISGGKATAGTWEYVLDDIEGTDNPEINDNTGKPYPTWKNVKIIDESVEFTIDPKAIYEKYTGSDRIVVDDNSSGILVKPEQFYVHNNVTWSTSSKVAV